MCGEHALRVLPQVVAPGNERLLRFRLWFKVSPGLERVIFMLLIDYMLDVSGGCIGYFIMKVECIL